MHEHRTENTPSSGNGLVDDKVPVTILVQPELLAAIRVEGERTGRTPEFAIVNALWQEFGLLVKLEPRNEWERRLFAIGIDCGAALKDEDFSSEALYD